VHSLALQLFLLEPVIKGNVGSVGDKLFIQAVDALCIRAMLAQHFYISLLILEVHWCTVKALPPWSVIAIRFVAIRLFFLLGFFGA
jgi:hypothetical protein